VSSQEEQLHALFTYCMEFAELMLRDAGEFYPFGATTALDGQVRAVGGSDGTERPDARELFAMLGESFAVEAGAGSILGAALAANVDIPADYEAPYPDAVRVHLEASGFSRQVYVPYKLSFKGLFRTSREVSFAEPFSVQVPPSFFLTAGA
jgi:hypothetical protein